MMFVILGIVILVVSFVIALYSLVREQKSADVEFPEEEPKKAEKAPEVPEPQSTVAQLAQKVEEAKDLAKTGPKTEQIEESRASKETQGPFFWEEKTAFGQDERKLEARVEQNQGKLSGQISLKDIPKSNDQ